MPTSVILAAKDIRQRLRDRSVIMFAVVVPLALAYILNLVFGQGATPSPFRYGVVDLDGGPAAQAFVSQVLDALERDDVITIKRIATVEAARQQVDDRDLDAAFVLPSGFSGAKVNSTPGSATSDSSASGGAAPDSAMRLDVIGNVDAPTASEVAHSIARSFVTELNGARVAAAAGTGSTGQAPDQAQLDRLAAAAHRAAQLPQALRMEDASAKTKILDSKTHLAAGMTIFFLFFTVQFGVASLIAERTDGTLRRLLSLPIRPSAVLLSKLLTSFAVGVVSTGVLLVATTFLLGASFGSPAGVALLVVTAVLSATGLAATIASMARTADQAGNWQAMLSTVLGLLGGTFFPVNQVAGLNIAAMVTPHAWFLKGLAELADGGGVVEALPASGALLAFALVFCGIGFSRLRRVVEL